MEQGIPEHPQDVLLKKKKKKKKVQIHILYILDLLSLEVVVRISTNRYHLQYCMRPTNLAVVETYLTLAWNFWSILNSVLQTTNITNNVDLYAFYSGISMFKLFWQRNWWSPSWKMSDKNKSRQTVYSEAFHPGLHTTWLPETTPNITCLLLVRWQGLKMCPFSQTEQIWSQKCKKYIRRRVIIYQSTVYMRQDDFP